MVENWKQYRDLEYYPDRVCRCGCGGRIEVKSTHKYTGIPLYIYGHNAQGKSYLGGGRKRLPREIRICACTCGGVFECITTSKQKFIYGHNQKNRTYKEIYKSRADEEKKKRKGKRDSTSKIMKLLWSNLEWKEKILRASAKGRNANWPGGSLNSHHPNFTESFKERIRSRDNCTCQLCNKIQEEEVLGRALSVHHIYYDAETNDCSNISDFVTLCVSCHMKTNYNRGYWQDYFESKFVLV